MSEIFDYKCPNCNASLEFDSASQKMKCPYCESMFEVETLKQMDESLNKTTLINNLETNELEYELVKDNTEITDDNTTIGTNTKLIINTIEYDIMLVGDVTEDGLINSADLLKIVKYLKGTQTLNDLQKNAADPTRDSIINSADLLKIVKYLKGTTELSF